MTKKRAAVPKPPPALKTAELSKVKYHPLAAGTYTGGSSGYRTPDRPDHRGVDIAANYGTPIYAPSDGVLVHVGINDAPGGFGSWLRIDAQQEWGLDFVVGHMPPSSLVNPDTGQRWRPGELVRAGQQIAVTRGPRPATRCGAATRDRYREENSVARSRRWHHDSSNANRV